LQFIALLALAPLLLAHPLEAIGQSFAFGLSQHQAPL
jgi:hypothetical protein